MIVKIRNTFGRLVRRSIMPTAFGAKASPAGPPPSSGVGFMAIGTTFTVA